MEHTDFPDLVEESRHIWDHNARWWDAKMEEGNDWHRFLIAPAVEQLLDLQGGERVLEMACGNGQFARRLAFLGARVVACDSSAAFLECARRRTIEHAERIEYRLIDLTLEEQLAAFGDGEFDAAVCNMALMDIASITPLLRALRRTLKARGRFVFSVPHPCFNTNGTTLLVERDDYQGDGTVTFTVRVRQYRNMAPQKGSASSGSRNRIITSTALCTACWEHASLRGWCWTAWRNRPSLLPPRISHHAGTTSERFRRYWLLDCVYPVRSSPAPILRLPAKGERGPKT